MELNLYSLEIVFVKSVRVKVELNLKKPLVPGVKIPLSIGGASLRIM